MIQMSPKTMKILNAKSGQAMLSGEITYLPWGKSKYVAFSSISTVPTAWMMIMHLNQYLQTKRMAARKITGTKRILFVSAMNSAEASITLMAILKLYHPITTKTRKATESNARTIRERRK